MIISNVIPPVTLVGAPISTPFSALVARRSLDLGPVIAQIDRACDLGRLGRGDHRRGRL